MNEIPIKEGPNAMEVASYLRRHPEFLSEYPDITLSLLVPREQGETTSLVSYQLEVLRDKNRELQRRLRDLSEVAAENELLTARVHAFTLGLMRERTLAETVHRVAAALTEDFHTELVRLVLFRADGDLPATDWLQVEPRGAAALPVFAEFLRSGEPLCGRLQQEKLDALFGARAEEVRSTALLPIGSSGMLAVGSHDANRFHPGMGTVFLKLMAAAVDTALARFPISA